MTHDDIREKSPLIIALDTGDLEQARRIARDVREYVEIVKVGLQLFSAEGPRVVEALREDGFEVFLDIKLSDIPNTVCSACLELCRLEPAMLTVHTMGGQEMMRACRETVDGHCSGNGIRRPLLIGVTVLTSLDLLALKKIGVHDSVDDEVVRLSRLAAQSGLDGLVASPLETLRVRREVGEGMLIVTPGVRLSGAGADDQKRVATPGHAVRSGADFLVVGRALCEAADPAAVARKLLEDARRPADE